MKISVPQSGSHPLVKITARTSDWQYQTTLDDSHKEFHISLPKGVSDDDVEVVAEFLDAKNEMDRKIGTVLLKSRTRKPNKGKSDVPSPSPADAAPASASARKSVLESVKPQAASVGLPEASVSEASAPVGQTVGVDVTAQAITSTDAK